MCVQSAGDGGQLLHPLRHLLTEADRSGQLVSRTTTAHYCCLPLISVLHCCQKGSRRRTVAPTVLTKTLFQVCHYNSRLCIVMLRVDGGKAHLMDFPQKCRVAFQLSTFVIILYSYLNRGCYFQMCLD